jgi:hypothetical protein
MNIRSLKSGNVFISKDKTVIVKIGYIAFEEGILTVKGQKFVDNSIYSGCDTIRDFIDEFRKPTIEEKETVEIFLKNVAESA